MSPTSNGRAPDFLQIEPVGRCNLRCRMCPVELRGDAGDGQGLLPFEVFTEILDSAAGVRWLHLQGLGEPLLHPRFFDMAAEGARRGMKVTTNTNLSLPDETLPARLAAGRSLAEIYVSVDSAVTENYEAIRRGARFETLERNLSALVRSSLGEPRIILVSVLMRMNYRDLPGLVRFAAEHGIRAVHAQHLAHAFGESSLPARYLPMRAFFEEQTLRRVPGEEVAAVFDAARAEAAREGIELHLPKVRPIIGEGACGWPWRGLYVTCAGTVLPCCMVPTPDRFNFGSIAGRGVTAVWHGDEYEEFRRQLASTAPPEICRSCSMYDGGF